MRCFPILESHVIGVPQIAPSFGARFGNVIFAGPGNDEDFGLEEITGSQADRYKFCTAPLRNLAVAPGFFHNGAFVNLEDAVRFHLDVFAGARRYDAGRAGVPTDLTFHTGPPVPRNLLDPLVLRPTPLSEGEINISSPSFETAYWTRASTQITYVSSYRRTSRAAIPCSSSKLVSKTMHPR